MDKKDKRIASLEGRFDAAGWGSKEKWSEAYKFYADFAYHNKGKNEFYNLNIKKENYFSDELYCLTDYIDEIPLVGMRKVKHPSEKTYRGFSSYPFLFPEPYFITGEKKTMKRISKKLSQSKKYVSSFMGIAGIIYHSLSYKMDESDVWENLLLNMGSALVGIDKKKMPEYFYVSNKERFWNLEGIGFKKIANSERWKKKYQDRFDPIKGFIYEIILLRD